MQEIPVRSDHVRKLLAAGDGDAALLYLCCAGGGSPEQSGLSAQRVERASALLRQLGVWENPAPRFQQAAERAGVADMAEGVAGFDANGAAPFYPEDLTGDTAPIYSYSQQLNAEVNEVREQIEDLKALLEAYDTGVSLRR